MKTSVDVLDGYRRGQSLGGTHSQEKQIPLTMTVMSSPPHAGSFTLSEQSITKLGNINGSRETIPLHSETVPKATRVRRILIVLGNI